MFCCFLCNSVLSFFKPLFSVARPVFKPYIYGFSAGEKRQLSLLSTVASPAASAERVRKTQPVRLKRPLFSFAACLGLPIDRRIFYLFLLVESSCFCTQFAPEKRKRICRLNPSCAATSKPAKLKGRKKWKVGLFLFCPVGLVPSFVAFGVWTLLILIILLLLACLLRFCIISAGRISWRRRKESQEKRKRKEQSYSVTLNEFIGLLSSEVICILLRKVHHRHH